MALEPVRVTLNNGALKNSLDEGERLYAEFEKRMNVLTGKRLVDFKLTFPVDNNTTTAGVVRTLCNVLRLIEAGEARPLSFDV